jgi:preprotein translocase subunit SecE
MANAQSSVIDKVKLAVAVALVCGGIAAFYLMSESAAFIRVGAILAGVALGAGVAWTSAQGKQFYAFAQESITETKKVVWPTRKETAQTTGIVFVFVVVMALFLWLVDAGLLWLVKLLMGRSD